MYKSINKIIMLALYKIDILDLKKKKIAVRCEHDELFLNIWYSDPKKKKSVQLTWLKEVTLLNHFHILKTLPLYVLCINAAFITCFLWIILNPKGRQQKLRRSVTAFRHSGHDFLIWYSSLYFMIQKYLTLRLQYKSCRLRQGLSCRF